MKMCGFIAHSDQPQIETDLIPYPDPTNCKCDICKPKGPHAPWTRRST